jgi:hypothetical protein
MKFIKYVVRPSVVLCTSLSLKVIGVGYQFCPQYLTCSVLRNLGMPVVVH